jgi:histidinol dehydrogenase
VRAAGAIFVGRSGATAFGDYVAGSNHCLPTNGAARFASGLSPRVFRRRVSQVHLDDAVEPLAVAGAALARAEGLPVHAESMEARVRTEPGHVVENSRP